MHNNALYTEFLKKTKTKKQNKKLPLTRKSAMEQPSKSEFQVGDSGKICVAWVPQHIQRFYHSGMAVGIVNNYFLPLIFTPLIEVFDSMG